MDASPATAWEALLEVDLVELARRRPLVGLLTVGRALPDLIASLARLERLPAPPAKMRLRDIGGAAAADGSWVLLGERPGSEIALGLVGRFWRR